MSYNRPLKPGIALKQSQSDGVPGSLELTLDTDIATTTSLGVIQVGCGLSITSAGILNALSNQVVTTKKICSNYQVLPEDCYIGVDSTGPVTVTLPSNPSQGKWIIIKLEMPAPIGIRKATVTTSNGSLIDGVTNKTMLNAYESIQLVYRGLAWHKI